MTRLSVSVPEAAEMLGLSRSSTYTAVQRGDIPSVRVGGRVLIPLQRLEELINGEHTHRCANDLTPSEAAAEALAETNETPDRSLGAGASRIATVPAGADHA